MWEHVDPCGAHWHAQHHPLAHRHCVAVELGDWMPSGFSLLRMLVVPDGRQQRDGLALLLGVPSRYVMEEDGGHDGPIGAVTPAEQVPQEALCMARGQSVRKDATRT